MDVAKRLRRTRETPHGLKTRLAATAGSRARPPQDLARVLGVRRPNYMPKKLHRKLSNKARKSDYDAVIQNPDSPSPLNEDIARSEVSRKGEPAKGLTLQTQGPNTKTRRLLAPRGRLNRTSYGQARELDTDGETRADSRGQARRQALQPPRPKTLSDEPTVNSAVEPFGAHIKPSSYWSVLEQRVFPKYIMRFGTDFEAMARYAKSKTEIMLRNRFVCCTEFETGVEGGKLRRLAARVDARLQRGEDMGPLPMPMFMLGPGYEAESRQGKLDNRGESKSPYIESMIEDIMRTKVQNLRLDIQVVLKTMTDTSYDFAHGTLQEMDSLFRVEDQIVRLADCKAELQRLYTPGVGRTDNAFEKVQSNTGRRNDKKSSEEQMHWDHDITAAQMRVLPAQVLLASGHYKKTLMMSDVEPWMRKEFLRSVWRSMGYQVRVSDLRHGISTAYHLLKFETSGTAARALQFNGQPMPYSHCQFKLQSLEGSEEVYVQDFMASSDEEEIVEVDDKAQDNIVVEQTQERAPQRSGRSPAHTVPWRSNGRTPAHIVPWKSVGVPKTISKDRTGSGQNLVEQRLALTLDQNSQMRFQHE